MYFLNSNQAFPPIEKADESGLLAISEHLSITRLIEAYTKGIFPWYNPGEPVFWYATNPRMILFPDELNVSKSMRKILRDKIFHFSHNKDFQAVIKNCRDIERKDQDGTWIGDEIIEYYTHLHHLGLAHSVEVWNQKNQLVGGLYGIKIKNVFCGESMFAKESNASKAGFIWWIHQNSFDVIDCQIYTPHLASLGAREIPIEDYLKFLK